jgi:hypothetical protein
MLRVIIGFANKMTSSVKLGVHVRRILDLSVLDNIARMKIAPWESYKEQMDAIEKKMEREFHSLYQELSDAGLIASDTA